MKNMTAKRLTLLALLCAVLLACTACGGDSSASASTTSQMPVVINQGEYVLYQNIFYNDYGPRYDGTETTKQGVFTTVLDAFSNVTRYYVWGYLDNTKCCDWQWEIKVKNTSNLPANGSLVSVKGTFASSDDALDGYWITDPQITLQTKYENPAAAELDMLTMSDTLERVQLMNVVYHPENFEGKTFSAYGRILTLNTLQDPYYDGSWQIPFTVKASSQMPAIGTTVELRGTVASGTLSDSTLKNID